MRTVYSNLLAFNLYHPIIFTRSIFLIKLSYLIQDYTITMYLNQYWKDERLAFSSDDEVLTLSGDFAEKIWVPDTFFANDKNRYATISLTRLKKRRMFV